MILNQLVSIFPYDPELVRWLGEKKERKLFKKYFIHLYHLIYKYIAELECESTNLKTARHLFEWFFRLIS